MCHKSRCGSGDSYFLQHPPLAPPPRHPTSPKNSQNFLGRQLVNQEFKTHIRHLVPHRGPKLTKAFHVRKNLTARQPTKKMSRKLCAFSMVDKIFGYAKKKCSRIHFGNKTEVWKNLNTTRGSNLNLGTRDNNEIVILSTLLT